LGSDLEELIRLENFKGVENSRYWQMDYGVEVDEVQKKLVQVNSQPFDGNKMYNIGILDYAINNPRDNVILQKLQKSIQDTPQWTKRTEYCEISFQMALRAIVETKFREIIEANGPVDMYGMDEDHDSLITFEELEKIVQNPEITKQLMKITDVNGDGVLDEKELAKLNVQFKSPEVRNLDTDVSYREILAKTDFAQLDLDKDGKVSLEELTKILGHEGTAQKLFDLKDKDKTGYLDIKELGVKEVNKDIRDESGKLKSGSVLSILDIKSGKLNPKRDSLG